MSPAARGGDRLALRIELDVGELVVRLRADELLGKSDWIFSRLPRNSELSHFDAVHVHLALVVGVGAVDRDEGNRDDLLFLERLQQRDLLRMRDSVEVRRLGDVDQLGEAERLDPDRRRRSASTG